MVDYLHTRHRKTGYILIFRNLQWYIFCILINIFCLKTRVKAKATKSSAMVTRILNPKIWETETEQTNFSEFKASMDYTRSMQIYIQVVVAYLNHSPEESHT